MMESPSKTVRELVELFTAAWHSDPSTDIGTFVRSHGTLPAPERRALIVHLIRVDLEFRWKAWEQTPSASKPYLLEDYAERVGEPAGPRMWPDELVLDEYRVRRLWGDRPDHESILARFPSRRMRLLPRLLEIDRELQQAETGVLAAQRAAPKPRRDEPEIPGYDVIEKLGQGGMGVVYRARQENLGRIVALKMILGGLPGDEATQRFLAEAAAVAAIKHPNVVEVYDYGEHDSAPYMVLEFCPGGALSKALPPRGQPLPTATAVTLVEKIARGVAAAHAAGIVHRDLKPGNVLLDESGEPKVADFGLAKRADGPDMTLTGAVLGTPSYMPPEQALGEWELVGPPSDVWALGVILYECLTGQLPFRGDTPEKTRAVVCTQEPIPVRSANPAVHRDVETICLKCLQKDRARRYADAGELADDLRRFLDDRPILARPVGRVEKLLLWRRRNKRLTHVGLIAVGLLVGVIGLSVLAARLSTDVDQEKARREGADAAAKLAEKEAGAAGVESERNKLRSSEAKAGELIESLRARAGDPRETRKKIADALVLEGEGRGHLTKLGPAGDPVDFAQRWAERKIALRNEATWWLSRFHVLPGRSTAILDITLHGYYPTVADTAGARIVVVPAGSAEAHVIDTETLAMRRLAVPASSATPSVGFGAARVVTLSPDGNRLLVDETIKGGPLQQNLVLIDVLSGERLTTLPLPKNPRFRLSATTRFVTNQRIEMESATPTEDAVWEERNGRWSVAVRPRKDVALPSRRNHPPAEGKNFVAEALRPADFDLAFGVAVRPRAGGAARTVWQINDEGWVRAPRSGSFDIEQERLYQFAFAPDSDRLYVLTTHRLVVIDVNTRERFSVTLKPIGQNQFDALARQLVPRADGAVLVERVPPGDPTGAAVFLPIDKDARGELRVTRWSVTRPELHSVALDHAGPVRSMLLTDGPLFTGGEDKLVRGWRSGELIFAGAPLALESGGGAAPVAGATIGRLYPRWELLGPGQNRILVERAERVAGALPHTDAEAPVATDLFDSADGRLLHTFPPSGTGRLLRLVGTGLSTPLGGAVHTQVVASVISSDGRFAVAVGAEDAKQTHLELWSLESCKPIEKLGSVPVVRGDGIPGGPRTTYSTGGLNVFFSPSGKWLFVGRPTGPNENGFGTQEWDVDVWQTGPAKRLSTLRMTTPLARCHFDPQETQAVLISGSFGSVNAAQLVRLDSGAKVADLAFPVGKRGELSGVTFAPGVVLFAFAPPAVGFVGEDRRPANVLFDRTTGARISIGDGAWNQGPAAVLDPGGKRLLLFGRKKPADPLDRDGDRKADIELWDIAGRKLVREAAISGRIFGLHNPFLFWGDALAFDHEFVYVRRNETFQKANELYHAIRWSDGTEAKPPLGVPAVFASSGLVRVWASLDGAVLNQPGGAERLALKESKPALNAGGLTDLAASVLVPSPDGSRIFLSLSARGGFGGVGPMAGVWDARTGDRLAALAFTDTFLGFDATGRRVLTVHSSTGVLTAIDLQTGARQAIKTPKPLDPFDNAGAPGPGGGQKRYRALLCGDGQLLVAPMGNLLQIWDVKAERPVSSAARKGHTGPVTALAEHARAGLIASGGEDGIVNLWQRSDGKFVKSLGSQGGAIVGLAFSGDGRQVFGAARDGTVTRWKVADGSREWQFPTDGKGVGVRALASAPDRQRLVVGCEDGKVILLDAGSGRALATAAIGDAAITTIAFRADGSAFACGTADGQVRFFSLVAEGLSAGDAWARRSEPVHALCFAPDGRHLFVGGSAVQFCEATSGRSVWQIEPPAKPVRAIFLNPATGELYVADQGSRVSVWPLAAWLRHLESLGLGLEGALGAR